MNMRSAEGLPMPNTTCVRPRFASLQRVQPDTSSASTSNAVGTSREATSDGPDGLLDDRGRELADGGDGRGRLARVGDDQRVAVDRAVDRIERAREPVVSALRGEEALGLGERG